MRLFHHRDTEDTEYLCVLCASVVIYMYMAFPVLKLEDL